MGCFIMENPNKMDDLGVPLFSETSIWIVFFFDGFGYMVGKKMSPFGDLGNVGLGGLWIWKCIYTSK